MSSVLFLHGEEVNNIRKSVIYQSNPLHLSGFPVEKKEGFLVGKKKKESLNIAMTTMICRVEKIIQGIFLSGKLLSMVCQVKVCRTQTGWL
jgi:hypothetical protein